MQLTSDQRASLSGVLNGLLVFTLPLSFLAYAYFKDAPSVADAKNVLAFLAWSGRSTLAIVLLAVVAAWRTRVYATHYLSGKSDRMKGVAEAALLGFLTFVFFVFQPAVGGVMSAVSLMLYGCVAAFLGSIVGLVLGLAALALLRISA